jgi:hypothetical protein
MAGNNGFNGCGSDITGEKASKWEGEKELINATEVECEDHDVQALETA